MMQVPDPRLLGTPVGPTEMKTIEALPAPTNNDTPLEPAKETINEPDPAT